MKTRLKITLAHLDAACRQLDQGALLFGGRPWEREVAKSHLGLWTILVAHLKTEDNKAIRHLLTLVFGVVFEARGGTLPCVPVAQWQALYDAYVPTGKHPDADSAEAIIGDLATKMGTYQAYWSELFIAALRQEPIGWEAKFFVARLTRMLLEAQEAEENEDAEDFGPFWIDSSQLEPIPAERERRATAKVQPVKPGVTFDDIGGFTAIKEEFRYLAKMVNQPEALLSCGIQPPRGVLLLGPSGTGKTYFAQAFASEVHKPFLQFNQAQNSSCFINASAQMVDDFFVKARKGGGAVIFFDEAEALFTPRGGRSTHVENIKVIAALNRNLQRPAQPDGILVILAANLKGLLDEAAIRTGRVDRIIKFHLPDRDDRHAVLIAHLEAAEKRAQRDLFVQDEGIKDVAELTKEFSCADLAEVVRRSLESRGRDVLEGRPFQVIRDKDLMVSVNQIAAEREKGRASRIGFTAPTSRR